MLFDDNEPLRKPSVQTSSWRLVWESIFQDISVQPYNQQDASNTMDVTFDSSVDSGLVVEIKGDMQGRAPILDLLHPQRQISGGYW